jgi:hypothetical protein
VKKGEKRRERCKTGSEYKKLPTTYCPLKGENGEREGILQRGRKWKKSLI